jgi:aromatic-L-amino-acid decarboxylase
MLDELTRDIMPGLTHWQHPSFFAFFPANASFPAMLGDMLCAGLGVQGMLWATSPACTELETRVLDWLAQALGLPAAMHSTGANGGGVIQGTASEAVVAAMVAARSRARVHLAEKRKGAKLTLYTSSQAHSSIVKAAMVTGLAEDADDREHVRLIAVDANCRMDVAALRTALQQDIAAGCTPFFVSCTVGTTGTTAIDSVRDVTRVVRELAPHCWVHVDAAHAGAACICPEFQWWLDGLEAADSFCMNPHKWLLTNFDCDCFWTSDRKSLTSSMSISPAYLRNQQSDAGSVIDYRDWHVPLGRRFRALKLWLVMKHYGVQGLQAYVREHIQLAAEFEGMVRESTQWELVAPRTMNLVCIALNKRQAESTQQRNDRTKAAMDTLNATGEAYCTHTLVPMNTEHVLAIRVAIGATLTQREHVQALWQKLQVIADAM